MRVCVGVGGCEGLCVFVCVYVCECVIAPRRLLEKKKPHFLRELIGAIQCVVADVEFIDLSRGLQDMSRLSLIQSNRPQFYGLLLKSLRLRPTCGAWWSIGRIEAFRPIGRRFESRSSRHVGTLGMSFTHSCCVASA